tara:strand:+ start:157 stop:402 length:246 start_codon:yes stop_codon:yes gene_type:complete
MSINWFTYTTYLKYKNECSLENKTCSNLEISETDKSGNRKDGTKCNWTNYQDYLRYKNMRLMVQDVDGTHVSLNNQKTIGM